MNLVFMLNKFFKLEENNTNLKTEFLAGLNTFLAMAYILGINPAMLSQGRNVCKGSIFCNRCCFRDFLHHHFLQHHQLKVVNQDCAVSDSFDQLHVGVGITHFKLSTTFSEICSIQYKQIRMKSSGIIYYFSQ